MRTSGRGVPHAAILYSEPGALGLVTNIMPALIVALGNIVDSPDSQNTANVISGAHLVLIGGLIQITTGLMSFRRNDHLTGTAFIVFASLWFFQGLTLILSENSEIFELKRSVLPSLLAYILIAVILFVCSLFVNYIMPPVLIAMAFALAFEVVGLFHYWGKYVAAAFEFIIVLAAAYAVIVMATKGVSQRYILPGFGNAPIDPLLLQRKGTGTKASEKKKNTKYAEPFGLGYMGNILPSLVFCFYHFGYITDFRVAFASILCNSFMQILAIYYAYLRQDFLYALQFSVYLAFWLSKGTMIFLIELGFAYPNSGYFGSLAICIVFVMVTLMTLGQTLVSFIYNLLMLFVSVLSLELIKQDVNKYTFGISAAVLCFGSLYISVASLLNSIAEKPVLFVGNSIVSQQRAGHCLQQMRCGGGHGDTDEPAKTPSTLTVPDTLTFIFNFFAAFALSSRVTDDGIGPLPWLLSVGVLGNLLCSRLCYYGGSFARCFVGFTYAVLWLSWSLFHFESFDQEHIRGAAVATLVLHTAALLMTTTFTKLWTIYSLAVEALCVVLVLESVEEKNKYAVLVFSLIVALIALYGVLAHILKGTLNMGVLPEGKPFMEIREEDDPVSPCPLFRSRMTSDLHAASRVLDQGHVIGVPTDTVYALAGSCKHPESVSKIYHIKGRPPEKPICLCVSSLDQLRVANPPFSPLLWRFMDLCYPGGITCVVKKGDWLRAMGVGDAVEYVGTKDSVAIRVPDSSVLSYLVSIHGPLAITSANPSGEPDSTHHDMVIDSLGEKLAGVVCDDESNESVASTVVNCMNIDKGEISYFRIGCTPQDIVDAYFEQAKTEETKPRT